MIELIQRIATGRTTVDDADAVRGGVTMGIKQRILSLLIDALFWPIEKDHCYAARLSEVQRSQLPSAYKG